MNYLALCRRAARECGVTASASIPAAVTSQTGELQRIVDWVAQAWNEIQNRHPNWRWMRSTWSLNTVAGTDSYAYGSATDARLSATVSRFKRWLPFDEEGYANVKAYLQSSGVGTETWLTYLPWNRFRALYKIGTQNNGQPAHFTIDPQNQLVFGPKPDAVYVVSGEYQMSAQTLDDDSDTPEMPSDYHMAIVYEAMKKYGAYEVAPEVFNRGEHEGNKLMRQLELDQLPPMALAEPLA